MTIAPERLAALDTITLNSGGHDSFDDGCCFNEAAAIRDAAWAKRRVGLGELQAKVRERLKDRPVAAAAAAADWGTSYSAAYKAACDYYRANPLPIMAQVEKLAVRQQPLALELLEALIDPQATS